MFRGIFARGQDNNDIDIARVNFDPTNAEHSDFINAKIKHFEEARDKLFGIDKQLGMAYGADSALWLSGWLGSWGPLLCLAGDAAIYLLLPAYLGREDAINEFTSARDDLIDLYMWCVKLQSVAVTNRVEVLNLLKAIRPFVQDVENLVTWDLAKVNPSSVSKEFLQELAKSPGGMRVVFASNQSGGTSLLASLWQSEQSAEKQPDNDNNVVESQVKGYLANSKWVGLFNRMKVDAACTFYGRRIKPVDDAVHKLAFNTN